MPALPPTLPPSSGSTPVRRSYVKPRLKRFGDLASHTQAVANMGKLDGAMSGIMFLKTH